MLFNNFGKAVNYDNGTEEIATEALSLITESAILDCLGEEELDTFLESSTEINAALREEILLEKSIVKLDKAAKISKAQKMAIFTIAKEKNDPIYKKLVTVWRMERAAEAKLTKKYGNEALRRAKKAVANMGKSTSNTVKKVSKKLDAQLNSVKLPGLKK